MYYPFMRTFAALSLCGTLSLLRWCINLHVSDSILRKNLLCRYPCQIRHDFHKLKTSILHYILSTLINKAIVIHHNQM